MKKTQTKKSKAQIKALIEREDKMLRELIAGWLHIELVALAKAKGTTVRAIVEWAVQHLLDDEGHAAQMDESVLVQLDQLRTERDELLVERDELHAQLGERAAAE